jgi:hypothetical protein
MRILLLFLFSFNLFAKCPEGAREHVMEMSFEPKRHVMCMKFVNGEVVKEGPYKKYRSDGKLVSTDYYKNNVKISDFPGVSAKTNSFVKSVSGNEKLTFTKDGKRVFKSKEYHFVSIAESKLLKEKFPKYYELLVNLENQFQHQKNKTFKIRGCRNYTMKWAMFLLTKKPQTLEYKFKKNCDIEGKIVLKNNSIKQATKNHIS